MSGRVDVIEVLRLANPVPPESRVEHVDASDTRRASLRIVPSDLPLTWPEAAPAHRRRWPKYAAAAAAGVAASVVALVVVADGEDGDRRVATTPDTRSAAASPSIMVVAPPTSVVHVVPTTPAGPFVGIWVSIDTDGSSQTMEIAGSGGDDHEIVVRDEFAITACAGASSTMTGTGRLGTDERLVIAQPELACDDGSTPAVGPPPQEELANFTFDRDVDDDELVDNFGVVWRREGAATTPASTTPAAPTSGIMWPQATVDEARQAQLLADAGEAAYAWQVDPQLASQDWWGHLRDPGTEVVTRFLRAELGWDDFLFNPYQGDDGDGAADGVIRGVVYVRCATGETNRLYPIAPDGHQEAPGAERCAPTIDELHYETVRLDLFQPAQRDLAGIWVVSQSAMTEPFAQMDPSVAEADATARLGEFLRARIAGEGAEGYVNVGDDSFALLEEVPLLYATTSGAAYERSEIERVSGPRWPYGEMEFKVRLFAEGGQTVVEHLISLSHGDGSLELWSGVTETTENGQPVVVPYGFFDGAVTASAAAPWQVSPFFDAALTMHDQAGDERLELMADPLPVATGCEQGPAPADAAALARSIRSDADLVATAPLEVSIGGAEGLQIDVTLVPGASTCETLGSPQVLTRPGDGTFGLVSPLDHGSRMRLYLLDLPAGSATRILAIAIVAPEARFGDVTASAAPIIESIELITG